MDDVGVGIIEFFCQYPSGEAANVIVVGLDEADIHGNWLDLQTCPSTRWVIAFKQSITPAQGSKDDDALNNILFYCSSDANGRSEIGEKLLGTGDSRTETESTARCPYSMVACGVKAAVDGVPDSDVTAINDIRLMCCFIDIES
ncbi:uncharacterized protein LOC122263175 [Penaeus japonicus]|uniref:uncharacterized protein LOC122263175 n=1 Tax=Penaeus japonicus TaxID=27405 RepID=UPI001C713C59|nr:uncharacterized protein LOC122263175 [Penaeus japonicus]